MEKKMTITVIGKKHDRISLIIQFAFFILYETELFFKFLLKYGIYAKSEINSSVNCHKVSIPK